jgi:PPK2 family polyphosphate:nucleotide phosphotransferase
MIKPKDVQAFIQPHRVDDGKNFRLADHKPESTGRFTAEDKGEAKELLKRGVEWLADEQEKLYAQDRWALLLIFQAMDAAGKDGVIQHVMSGVNPQGCQVYSFKAPSSEELDHDYLWRCQRCMPERGRIGIFNRSYYEETLIVRVHRKFLEGQKLPPSLVNEDIWNNRFEDIRNYERYLTRNGVAIRKFFLHVSKEEQRKRFLSRLSEPEKNWKFSVADVGERAHWNAYQHAYEEMVKHTASEHAPWFVVPADNKWYTRLVVAAAVVDALESLKLQYPKVSAETRRTLKQVQASLESER